jgi:hypothetical protein
MILFLGGGSRQYTLQTLLLFCQGVQPGIIANKNIPDTFSELSRWKIGE